MMKTTMKQLHPITRGRVMKTEVKGPLGELSVELQDDDLWSVEEIFNSAGLTGSQYIAAYPTHREAVTLARKCAGLPELGREDSAMRDEVDAFPLPDRRGAVEHTRAKLC